MRVRAVFAIPLASWLLTSEALGQELSTDDRLVVHGTLLFAGESELEYDGGAFGTTIRADLDVGGGLGLRYETVLADYLLLGAEFGFYRVDTDGASDPRTYLDFGVVPTFAMAFDLGDFAIEPRVGLPLGFDLHIPDDDARDSLDGTGIPHAQPGFYVGLTGGAAFYFTERFGALLELGLLRHAAYAKDSNDDRWKLHDLEGLARAGFVLRL